MSDSYQIIVNRDASEAEAPRLRERMEHWLAERGVLGAAAEQGLGEGPHFQPGPAYGTTLESPKPRILKRPSGWFTFNVGRRIVFSIPGGEVTCRACGARVDLDEHGDAWTEAVGLWSDGGDAAEFACPECGQPERLTEWGGEWPWGFGNLGLEFWNWTPLSERFVREVTAQMGHRTVLVRGKL